MYEELKKIIEENDNIVFFGGAGISTESNIPDFRSTQGINKIKRFGKPPVEMMLSASYFNKKTKDFYKFYFNNLVYPEALPNRAHYALARLEKQGKLKAVITQNIDGLHQSAGSKNVLELHGSILRNYCKDCNTSYTLEEMLEFKKSKKVPTCRRCKGVIKPDVVLYEEILDNSTVDRAVEYISKADVLIIGGTSLVVYPAAGLLRYFKGKTLVLINKDETKLDERADIVIHDSIANVLDEVIPSDI
ncbi:MAG: NAD-dependent protein deacylase [Erysipelotrichaceae bacterium]